MKLTYRLLALVALMLVVNVTVHAQQKGESRVDKFVRKHEAAMRNMIALVMKRSRLRFRRNTISTLTHITT